MTCPEDETAVLLLPTRVEGDDVEKGGYVKLSEGQESSSSSGQEEEEEEEVKEAATSPFWFWVKLALLFSFLASLAFVAYRWLGPLIMDKVCSLLQPNACLLVSGHTRLVRTNPIVLALEIICVCFICFLANKGNCYPLAWVLAGANPDYQMGD